jgi:rhodanese-related sulfurtransferase
VANLPKSGDFQVIDVREDDEYAGGHIEGAHHLNYKNIWQEHRSLSLDKSKPIIITCAAGIRASTAASILQRSGYTQVTNLRGGMDAWLSAGLPIKRGQ